MAIRREPAHRVFAPEFRASRVHLQGEGEMAPSYVVTPLGAKMNRLHVVGVCTEVEPIGESGDMLRARISDGTGVFTVQAGQYQQEAHDALDEIASDLPCFVAITGKARAWEPEPGQMVCSIRPESVHKVDEATRNQWILDTARRTNERLAAIAAVGDNLDGASEQVKLASQHYGLTDTDRFRATIVDALQSLLPDGEVQVHTITPGDEPDEGRTPPGDAPTWTPPPKADKVDANPEQDALDDTILAIVGELQGDSGADWDDILQKSASGGASSEGVEESLNRLMDKGLVYEPTLGVLKTT
jgi:RPA family protein